VKLGKPIESSAAIHFFEPSQFPQQPTAMFPYPWSSRDSVLHTSIVTQIELMAIRGVRVRVIFYSLQIIKTVIIKSLTIFVDYLLAGLCS
jgi:hypothetical protein